MMEVNNDIIESKCGFALSQDLYSLGFNVICKDKWMMTLDGTIVHSDDIRNCIEHDRAKLYAWQPTHSVAIAWLRKNFDTNIYAVYEHGWIGVISSCSGDETHELRTKHMESIEYALEDAIRCFIRIKFFGVKL